MGKIETVESFLAALKDSPDAANIEGYFTPEVELESTAGNSSGRNAVVKRFLEPAGANFRNAWRPLEEHNGGVKATGDAAQGTIVLFYFEGDKISRMQHQFFTVRQPGSGGPVKMTEEMKGIIRRSLAERHPIVVAYVDEKGAPQLSFRGSIQAFSDDQLAVWVRPESRLVECVEKNPHVSFLYRNEDTHAGFNIQGRGRISRDPAELDQVYNNMDAIEQERDMARLGVALIVDIDVMEGSIVRLKRESERVRMERNEA